MTLFPNPEYYRKLDTSSPRAVGEKAHPLLPADCDAGVVETGVASPALIMPPIRREVVFGEGPTERNVQMLERLWWIAGRIQETPTLRLQQETLAEVSDLVSAFKSQLASYTPFQAITGLTSLATIGYRDVGLFKQLHDQLKGREVELSPPALADLAWSCGRLAVKDGAILDTVKKMALRKERAARMHEREHPRSVISFKERALIAWGAAVACPEGKRQDFVKQFAHPQDLEGSSVSLNYWHLMYQALVIAGILDDKEQFDQLQQIEDRREERLLNQFEAAVLHSAMSLLGEDRCDYHIHERIGGVEADLVIRTPQGAVVIESDGEAFHRLIGPDGGVLQGKDQGQDIFFSKLGIDAVIHVGSWEWDSLWGEEILREKIENAAPFLLNRP